MARSGSGNSASFASTAFSPSALLVAAFCSWRRSFIAARSSSENRLVDLSVAVVLFADFCVPVIGGFLSARSIYGMTLMLGGCRRRGFSKTARSDRHSRRHRRPRARHLVRSR